MVGCEQSTSALRQPADHHLEGGIAAQGVAVVAIGVPGVDQQSTEADHLHQRVLDALKGTRALDAGRQALADPKPPVDLGQQQQAAIEGGVNRLAGNC